MRHPATLCALFLFVAACQTGPANADEIQSIVANIAANNGDIVRLTVHMMSGDELTAVASTSDAKRGKPSDPEDRQAIANGETVVLAEGDNTDVTVPIRKRDGAFTAAVGVTMQGRDAAAAQSRAAQIAADIDDMLQVNRF